MEKIAGLLYVMPKSNTRIGENNLYTLEISKLVEKIIYDMLDLKICLERSGFKQRKINKIVGCKATKDLKKNKVVGFGDIERG